MSSKSPGQLSTSDLHGWLQKDSSELLLIDVREDKELEIAPFPFPVMHLPLSQSSQWIGSLPNQLPRGNSLVVMCHAGIRSLDFATWLIHQEWMSCNVWNLEGGIDAWSQEVDPTIPRY